MKIKKYFLTGLAIIIPFVLTIYILAILFRFVDNIFGRFLNVIFKKIFGFYIPGLGFLFFILFIYFVGFLANRYIGKKFLYSIERWFFNLPFIRNIYPGFKQLSSFLFEEKEIKFKKVVLVEYPSKGIFSLGFLTKEEIKDLDNFDEKLVSVFIPSTPNPLTGFLIFVPKDNLKFLDLSVSDAMKIIFSGGFLVK